MSTQETNLQAIADAIRAKTGKTDSIKASDFAAEIAAISTGAAKPKWTQTTLPAEEFWYSVTYGNGKFVAVASGTIAAYSEDGITWTQTTLPAKATWNGVTYGGGKFVAVAYDNNIAAYSEDGITWTQTTLPAKADWWSVTYGNGKFVAVARDNTIAAYLKDAFDVWG